jgi:alkyl sulfatase BDS1-like metallo-beta-lactamase superfamily hydrolase
MGYQSENATWRNAYLMGAMELRHGVVKQSAGGTAGPDVIRALPTEAFFDYLGVRLNGDRALGKRMVVNWTFTDSGERYALNLDHSALTYLKVVQPNARPSVAAPVAEVSVTLERATLDAITLRQTTFPQAIAAGKVKVEGSAEKLRELFGLFDTFDANFAIVEPRQN